MTRPARFVEADAVRALRAAKRAGCEPHSFRVLPDGEIIVSLQAGRERANDNPWDEELLQ